MFRAMLALFFLLILTEMSSAQSVFCRASQLNVHSVTSITGTGTYGGICAREYPLPGKTHVVMTIWIKEGDPSALRFAGWIKAEPSHQNVSTAQFTWSPNGKVGIAILPWPNRQKNRYFADLRVDNITGEPMRVKIATSEINPWDIMVASGVQAAILGVGTIAAENLVETLLDKLWDKESRPNVGPANARIIDGIINVALNELSESGDEVSLDRAVVAIISALRASGKISTLEMTFLTVLAKNVLYNLFRGTVLKIDIPHSKERVEFARRNHGRGNIFVLNPYGEGSEYRHKFEYVTR